MSTQVVITGTYGMQAVIDDNNSIYLRDWAPFEETHYRARFYFDPNTITMAHGDAYYIFYALNRDDTVLAHIELRFSAGDYQVRAEVVNDADSWSSSSWVTITDGPHALEIDWFAATAAGANNGGLTFWVDGTQIASFTTVDNDTRWIDYVLLGTVAGVDRGTRGTYFMDAFESRRTTYIGLANGAPEPPAPPEKTDDLFADGFESGNFGAWSSVATDGGDLSVSTQAAITGTYGMKAYIDSNGSIYTADWKPFEETHYRARFYFDPNSLTMSNGNAFYLFYALNRDDVVVARVEFARNSSLYQARAQVVDDSSTWSSSSWITLSDAPHYIEIDWKAATASGANNGVLTYWLDGSQQASFTTIDNDTRKVDYVQLGAVSGVDSGSRGKFYMDAFVSRRDTYIGEASLLDTGNVRVAHSVAAKVLAAPVAVQDVPVEESEPQEESPTGQMDAYTPVSSQPAQNYFAPLNAPPEIPLAAQGQPVTTTITYTYRC